jgi:quinol-cytochrome oxidoreductase complex cytochrome b subunit
MRYIHANGASFFFIVMYIHVFRGLYYGSYTYPRQLTWYIGVTILLLTIVTAFLGYVLPWGQMSFWGATVITNLVSAVPIVGQDIVYWLWGGFAIDNATLNRFYSLHFLLPFVIAALSAVHLMTLHQHKSNNPIGIVSAVDRSPFHPYFTMKDLLGMSILLIIFGFFVFFEPNVLGHPDNYIPANPLVTPSHIVPEWYFLPFYAILRSIPDKLGGVLAMLASILILYALPILHTCIVRSTSFRPIYKIVFWFLLVNCIILAWIGGSPVETPYYETGQNTTILYFLTFASLIPIVGKIENYLLVYRRNID